MDRFLTAILSCGTIALALMTTIIMWLAGLAMLFVLIDWIN